jgi:hypothetical protein
MKLFPFLMPIDSSLGVEKINSISFALSGAFSQLGQTCRPSGMISPQHTHLSAIVFPFSPILHQFIRGHCIQLFGFRFVDEVTFLRAAICLKLLAVSSLKRIL